MTQSELAKKSHICRSTISKLSFGRLKREGKYASAIAHSLNVSEDWLMHGEGNMENYDLLVTKEKIVPMLTKSKISKWLSGETSQSIIEKDGIITTKEVGNRAFAFKVSDNDLWPYFDTNTIIIVDPDKLAIASDFVLVFLKNPVIRLLTGPNEHLALKRPDNKYSPIKTKKQIIGCIVESLWINNTWKTG